MLFNSLMFIAFFLVVFLLYSVIPKKMRSIFLLIVSYVFYMGWNVKYIFLIMFSTLTTYGFALLIEKADTTENTGIKRKFFLILGLVFNLLILAIFKYADGLLHNFWCFLHIFNIYQGDGIYLNLLLPVGISFYTFQSLSYLIDVYRRDVAAEKNLVSYALYVSFFPQLVAGPIERSKNLLSQISNIENIQVYDFRRITSGLIMMIYGYFLKMVIADRLAVYVDAVFNEYLRYNSSILIMGCIFFGIQIYCDFNAYSLIAIGCAKVMGINLMENFDSPYFSKSVTEFWRRWHISLTSWFKDYLYIPLGGSKCGKLRNCVNIMIVFLTSGLWHGADWSFVIWGGLNGIYQVIEKTCGNFIKEKFDTWNVKSSSFSYRAMKGIITFAAVDFAWIFFRAPSVKDALGMIKRIVTRWDPWVFTGDHTLSNLLPRDFSLIELEVALFFIVFIAAFDWAKYHYHLDVEAILKKQCIWFRWGIYLFMLWSILVFGIYGEGYNSSVFMYFQF